MPHLAWPMLQMIANGRTMLKCAVCIMHLPNDPLPLERVKGHSTRASLTAMSEVQRSYQARSTKCEDTLSRQQLLRLAGDACTHTHIHRHFTRLNNTCQSDTHGNGQIYRVAAGLQGLTDGCNAGRPRRRQEGDVRARCPAAKQWSSRQ